MRLKTAPFESDPPESKTLASAASAFRNGPAEPFFDQGPKGRAFLPRYPAGLPEKAISNLYGCLHMATHIIAAENCQDIRARPLSWSSRPADTESVSGMSKDESFLHNSQTQGFWGNSGDVGNSGEAYLNSCLGQKSLLMELR